MTDNDIPMWALNAACERSNLEPWAVWQEMRGQHSVACRTTLRNFAALIAKHEQPPVDPEEEEAKALAAEIGWNFAWEAVLAGIKHGRLQREKEGKRA